MHLYIIIHFYLYNIIIFHLIYINYYIILIVYSFASIIFTLPFFKYKLNSLHNKLISPFKNFFII